MTIAQITQKQFDENKEVFQSLKDHDEGRKVILVDSVKKALYEQNTNSNEGGIGFLRKQC